MEKTVIINGHDLEVIFDFEVTKSRVYRVGHIGLSETIIEDWQIDIESVNGISAKHFTDEGIEIIKTALQEETDLLQEQYEAHCQDHICWAMDRRAV
jgi:hypothetical protein